jgi:hypothetical protein
VGVRIGGISLTHLDGDMSSLYRPSTLLGRCLLTDGLGFTFIDWLFYSYAVETSIDIDAEVGFSLNYPFRSTD